jgi:growth arrest-specific protein 8
VAEVEMAISAKDREMELLEDNHRVELRVYQQKVKHLEFEHKNNIKGIVRDGTGFLETEQEQHATRERDLLKFKEQLKFDQMELEIVNASKIADIRQQHEKQQTKLRSQFDEGLGELTTRYESRLKSLEFDLELRRRVEIHEVEERKNQHINDLVRNHKKAFSQMKLYYNEITRGNLQLISNLQKQTEELKTRATSNKRMLLEYAQENQNLSKPLAKVSAEIADLQGQLKERTKDHMALRNAMSRLNAVKKKSTQLRESQIQLEEDYKVVEKERDSLYNTFEESIQRVRQQSEFHNEALEQRLRQAEETVDKAAFQIEEIIRAANLDGNEMARVMMSINQMLTAKNEALRDVTFLVAKLKKNFNDALSTYSAKFKELGISQVEIDSMGFNAEELLAGTSFAPSGMLAK